MTTEQARDWFTDYDIFDPEFIRNPYPIWQDMREECPIAHTGRYQGSWMPTKYDDLFKMAQDIEHLSSRDILVVPVGPPEGRELTDEERQFEGVSAPPITADPPEHTWSRRLLLPRFSITAVSKYEEATREHCRHLLDQIADKGRADAAADYAQQIPPYVIAMMLGVPAEMCDQFTQWTRQTLEFGLQDPESGGPARIQLLTFLWGQIQDRRAHPKDDLLTYLAQSEVNGAPAPDQYILGTAFLLVLAGIDTTWSSIGSALWHLAQAPDDRRRIIEDPAILPTAVEELLRAYSPVTMARYVAKDIDYNGCPMKEGDRVLMTFPAANRDPAKFADADKVIIDRQENPHIAFGAGIHRCAGSNLARMEMRVSIQEWLARIPDYQLEDPKAVTWAGGQVRGPRKLPVVF